MKQENVNFFEILNLFGGLTPLKFKKFIQNLKNSTNIKRFAHNIDLEIKLTLSLHHNMKKEIFNIFWIFEVIQWANTFEIREFRLKIENFHQLSELFPLFSLIKIS